MAGYAQSSDIDAPFKLVIIGDPGVGKSRIFSSFLNRPFLESEDGQLAIGGVDFAELEVEVEERTLALQIWDSCHWSGTIAASLLDVENDLRWDYRHAKGVILVYDITSKETFYRLSDWMESVRKFAPEEVKLLLLGNKSDLEERRAVSTESGKEMAAGYSMEFLETSAQTSCNLEKALKVLARSFLHLKNGETISKQKKYLNPTFDAAYTVEPSGEGLLSTAQEQGENNSAPLPFVADYFQRQECQERKEEEEGKEKEGRNETADFLQSDLLEKSLSDNLQRVLHLSEEPPFPGGDSFSSLTASSEQLQQDISTLSSEIQQATQTYPLEQAGHGTNPQFSHYDNQALFLRLQEQQEKLIRRQAENRRTIKALLSRQTEQHQQLSNQVNRAIEEHRRLQSKFHKDHSRVIHNLLEDQERQQTEHQRQLQEVQDRAALEFRHQLQELCEEEERRRETDLERVQVSEHERYRREMEFVQEANRREVATLREHHEQEIVELRAAVQQRTAEVESLRIHLEEAREQVKEAMVWKIDRQEIDLSGRIRGTGGWASVTEGKFRGCPVAVKQLHNLIIAEHNLALFAREMSLAARLRHPCIVQFIGGVVQLDIRQGEPFPDPMIITELMDTDLRHILPSSPSHKDLKRISIDVALALNFLHQCVPDPIIHRDVSSANVLLHGCPGKWHAKLSDLGSANVERSCLTVGPGAPPYSSPEATHPEHHSSKMDCYSFAVLLLEMFIQPWKLPAQGKHRECLPLLKDDILRQAVSSCLEENPVHRPRISEVLHVLQNLE